MRIFRYMLIIPLILLGEMVFAQNIRNFEGTVKDQDGNPIEGALITSSEGLNLVLTDAEGNYRIAVGVENELVITAEGFQKVEIDALEGTDVVMMSAEYLKSDKDVIQFPFRKASKRNTTGSVSNINIKDEMQFDQRLSLGNAIDGRVPGLIGTTNIWGRGGAIVVVDGIARSSGDYNLNEIESISVLKDPVSRALYGAQADQGVIMINTRRGEANRKVIEIMVEGGVSTPKALPDFLGSADYMGAFNQALLNDGGIPRYTDEDISNAGTSPLYPDEDFYSDTYLRDVVNFYKVYFTASGGTSKTRYFTNVGWTGNQNWYKLSGGSNNKFNFRGNVDFSLHKNVSMRMDAIAVFNFENGPNINDYWGRAASVVPNAYPALWDPASITDQAEAEEILQNAVLVDGKLLGGNNTFPENIYGDFVLGGNRTQLDRVMQFNTGLDWDLSSLTPGLKLSGFLTFDFVNSLVTFQDSKYAVYNPIMTGTDSISAQVIGEYKPASNYSTETNSALFQRRLGYYGALSYDRTFNDHDFSAVAVVYRDQLAIRDMEQDNNNLHFGLNTNYAYKGKYLFDISLVGLGSQKLAKDKRMAFAPSIGAGWILSDEAFMNYSKTFLKVKVNYGILKNDNWDNYMLHQTTYQRGRNFFYENRSSSNEAMNIVNRGSEIGWQTRKEFSFGVDVAVLNKNLWLEATFFDSKLQDQVTPMVYTYPTLMGAVPYYSNYNATSNSGVDLGISYTNGGANWDVTIGSNMIYTEPKIDKIDEPVYGEDQTYLYQAGTATDAIWGLEADGLYSENDFTVVDYENQIFELNDGLPTSAYGNVQPGDIKYLDQDNNGVINDDDRKAIGNKKDRMQFSLYLKLRFKQFELFAMGIGRMGDYGMRSGNYFRFYGDHKYPTFANEAYGPSNKNVNAPYPRLSSSNNSHNFRNSTYWMYENNWFKIPAIQLTYNIVSKNYGGVVKDARVYLRASDIVTLGSSAEIIELNVNSAPQTRSFALGFVTKF